MVHTGMTSVTNLPAMADIYPFAGYEWLFTIVAAGFFVMMIVKQISLESEQLAETDEVGHDFAMVAAAE